MRILCPHCGDRDRREFYIKGAVVGHQVTTVDEVDRALHLRDNPAGRTREFWHHEAGCRAWLIVERDTLTHEIYSVAGAV